MIWKGFLCHIQHPGKCGFQKMVEVYENSRLFELETCLDKPGLQLRILQVSSLHGTGFWGRASSSQCLFKSFHLKYLCMCVCQGDATWHVWKSEVNLSEFVLSFYHVDPGHPTQVNRFGGKCLYLPHHLASLLKLPFDLEGKFWGSYNGNALGIYWQSQMQRTMPNGRVWRKCKDSCVSKLNGADTFHHPCYG